MNSSYQINKFYAQERVNAHQIAAQAHRQARQARHENGRHSIASIAAAQASRAYHWTGRAIIEVAWGIEEFGKANVAARYPYIR